MLLAADVGGTKTLIGLYRQPGPRPAPVETRVYATLDFANMGQLVDAFLGSLGGPGIDAIAAGVAGPVRGLTAELTNAPWTADLDAIARRLNCRAALLNDLEAMGYAVSVLEAEELLVLQEGTPNPTGNAGLIAAGTGLNESHIQRVDGALIPSASEAGHADFSARTNRDLAFAAWFLQSHDRVAIEDVLSGPGLVNLYHFMHQNPGNASRCPAATADGTTAALVSTTALSGACPRCADALDMFVAAYGAETGNLALRSMTTAGVYVGGGIAPRILPALQTGTFMDAFRSKTPMEDVLAAIPVKVILNPAAALIGASVKAASLIGR
jgi:glucokinase